MANNNNRGGGFKRSNVSISLPPIFSAEGKGLLNVEIWKSKTVLKFVEPNKQDTKTVMCMLSDELTHGLLAILKHIIRLRTDEFANGKPYSPLKPYVLKNNFFDQNREVKTVGDLSIYSVSVDGVERVALRYNDGKEDSVEIVLKSRSLPVAITQKDLSKIDVYETPLFVFTKNIDQITKNQMLYAATDKIIETIYRANSNGGVGDYNNSGNYGNNNRSGRRAHDNGGKEEMDFSPSGKPNVF